MKISIIGGAGVRTPILVAGLVRSDLPIDELSLYDPDQPRLAVMVDTVSQMLAQGQGPRRPAMVAATDPATCVQGARFVIISIRPGGIMQRARDERAALDLGLLGQETVGAAGFAMAVRTIPPMIEYARLVADLAPDAWIISFTNPVGIVTQAVRTEVPGARIIGICDTPAELFQAVAYALGVPGDACFFDYVGLNHLGWLREVWVDGRPRLRELLGRPEQLAGVYRIPLFPLPLLERIGILPTEYLYYYYRTADAVANLRAAGRSRAEALMALNESLFRDLAGGQPDNASAAYERYLSARNAGYMAAESGASEPAGEAPWAHLTGYDKIGVAVARAIHADTGDVIPLNVANLGNIDELEADDVVEVPCAIGSNGPLPLHVGRLPPAARELMISVKKYERLTVAAALDRSRGAARAALAAHPLVGEEERADAFLAAAPPW